MNKVIDYVVLAMFTVALLVLWPWVKDDNEDEK